MSYGYPSTKNPRLLILLTDELEESVMIVNRLIDQQIMINFSGDSPRNRCFISVIGYNHHIKDLCSGWLKDIDDSPLHYEILKKKIPDGTGHLVELEIMHPIWVEETKETFSFIHYAEAIKLAKEIAEKWAEDYALPPIVIDCSTNCHAECALYEIEQIKNIQTKDGDLLFFSCYCNGENIPKYIFSKIPKEWDCILDKCEIMRTNTSAGCFTPDTIWGIISGMSDCAGEAGVSVC